MLETSKKIMLSVCLVVLLLLPQLVLAGNNPPLNVLDNVAASTGPYAQANNDTLVSIVGNVVGIALGLIGIVFLGLMLFAGYNWMTAQGDEEKVGKAKSIIIQTIIGIIIIVGAYASWAFLFEKLLK
ncbi:MAG: hypothetical protein PHS62_02655 [Patescibacteria group bacterium]|nr:hypothetical protein [Patescibacteria group bacterium]